MPRRLERKIEDDNVKYAKNIYDMQVRKMNGMGFRSWPDRQFFYRSGFSFFIEYKLPDKPLTRGQAEMIKTLRGLGYAVYVIDDAAVGRQVIDRFVQLCEDWARRRKTPAPKKETGVLNFEQAIRMN